MPRLAKFKPHIVLACERTRPAVGTVAQVAMVGVDRLLTIPLDTRLPSATYLAQARRLVPVAVPAFGKVMSFVICYREDFCVRHALDWTVLETLDHPVPLPVVYLETIH
jgi:hypothetical protein